MGEVVQRTDFQITLRHHGEARRVHVTIYDDLDQLREHAATEAQGDGQDYNNALAVTSRWSRYRFTDSSSAGVLHPLCARIRLTRNHLTMAIITHEVGHAALHIWQLGNEDHALSTDDIDGEEEFCYLLGELAARLVRRLHHYGFYDS